MRPCWGSKQRGSWAQVCLCDTKWVKWNRKKWKQRKEIHMIWQFGWGHCLVVVSFLILQDGPRSSYCSRQQTGSQAIIAPALGYNLALLDIYSLLEGGPVCCLESMMVDWRHGSRNCWEQEAERAQGSFGLNANLLHSPW